MRKSKGGPKPPLSAAAVVEMLPRLAAALRALPITVITAYVFGSYGRLLKGGAGPGPLSDLDVAVLLADAGAGSEPAAAAEPTLYLQTLAALVDAAGSEDIDLVILNQAPPGLRFAVLQDGVAFLTHDAAARSQYENAVVRTYQDMEPFRSHRWAALRNRVRRGEPA